MGKHIPRTHNGYNIRCNGSSSDQFNAVASDVKTTAIPISSLVVESILSYVNKTANSRSESPKL
jgi:hypothetical protein